jgi:Phage integrase, N-terminal SAM-like domain/Phage integrase family
MVEELKSSGIKAGSGGTVAAAHVTNEEWKTFWLAKVSDEVERLNLSQALSRFHYAIVNKFLTENPGNPKAIDCANLISFIARQPNDVRPPLVMFYEAIAPSQKHVAALKNLTSPPPGVLHRENTIPPVEGKIGAQTRLAPSAMAAGKSSNISPVAWKPELDQWIARLSKELEVRSLSRRTLAIYTNAVRRYLETLGRHPAPTDDDAIKTHLLYLKSDKGLAPRTVNLAAAGITFFYREVVGNEEAVTGLPRMKVGKSLPKVYGQGDVQKLLDAASNPKHKLVLALAYGCGLRLNEIVMLKPANINWDRNVIRIQRPRSKLRGIFHPYGKRNILIRSLTPKQASGNALAVGFMARDQRNATCR